MAIGDAAAAAGMALVSGASAANTLDTEDNLTRDYIAQRTQVPGTALPVAKGGTGAVTPAAAAVALNVPAWTDVAPKGNAWSGLIARYSDAGRMQVVDPAVDVDVANLRWVNARIAASGGGSGLADGPTSAAYGRGTTGSAYFAVWMNAQLQFFRNTSARRYKERIRDWSPAEGAVMGLRTVIFDRIDGDPDEVGFIAEEVGDAGLGEAVVYFDGEVDGINDRTIVAALLAHVQELTRRLETLEAKG